MTFISATGKIRIRCDHKAVFEFISNLENDKYWRKEIHSTIMSGTPQVGTTAREDSFLSERVPHHLQVLQCIEYTKGEKIVYRTLPEAAFMMKSTRQVNPVTEKECEFFYAIEFDKNIVKHGLGFALPTFVINMVVKRDMARYIKQLKTFLEKQNHPS